MVDLRPGDRSIIFSADLQRYAEVRFKEWLQLTRTSRKVAVFVRLETNEQINVSNAGLRKLERAHRIRPVGSNARPNAPGSWMSLPATDLEAAKRAMHYVDRYYRFREAIRTTRGPSKEHTKAFLAEVAAEREEPPPSYEWLHQMIGRDRDGTRFDRVMNFARKPRRGNESPRLPALIQEALDAAAQFAWEQPSGDYKTLREHFISLMMNDERFASVRHLGINDNGASLISKSTFDARLAAVDHYTRDLLRFGGEHAAVENQQYIRIHRPRCLMDIVDVDHLKTDLFAYLDENPLAFGRLDLIVFRERMSGVILAAVPSFGDPSYTTFVRGLELAIFGVEGRLRVDVPWPWFGLFNKLGVDNALHFIGESIREAAKALGFDIIEHRPARPGDKGALERFLGTITRDIFHMLPGTTMESPKIREMFGEDRDLAVPLLALSEVETVLQYWIANVYHQTPRQGLGGDLTTHEGVPADLWTKHGASIPRRPLLDRTIFTRLAGHHKRVTVQKDGVRAHNVTWNAPGLLALSLHPKTKRAIAGRDSTKFDLHINPFNIAQAWVVDPYQPEVVTVLVNASLIKTREGEDGRIYLDRSSFEDFHARYVNAKLYLDQLDCKAEHIEARLQELGIKRRHARLPTRNQVYIVERKSLAKALGSLAYNTEDPPIWTRFREELASVCPSFVLPVSMGGRDVKAHTATRATYVELLVDGQDLIVRKTFRTLAHREWAVFVANQWQIRDEWAIFTWSKKNARQSVTAEFRVRTEWDVAAAAVALKKLYMHFRNPRKLPKR